jgi:hypothetical protein
LTRSNCARAVTLMAEMAKSRTTLLAQGAREIAFKQA